VEIASSPDGRILFAVKTMFGGSFRPLIPMIKPTMRGVCKNLIKNLDLTGFIKVETVKGEIDKLMSTKLEELTPNMVKVLLEEMIREHLGWLIVWGNIFGGGIGVITYCLALLIPGN